MIGILTAAMAVTVYAGGGSGVSTYEELVEFMESEQGGSLWGITPAEDFGWPEEEITLVFDDWRGLNVWEDWTIPENVTIIAEEDFTSYGATVTVDGTLICNGLTNNYFKPEHANPNPDKSYQERYADTNLIVNGSVTLKYYQDDRFFQNITINDGGVLKANIIVDESGSLTVNQGGTIDTIASVKIYGKAEFSGEITLPWIDALGGTVTVTETGVVYCGNIYQLEKAEIAGDLFVRGGINLSNYESSDEIRQYGTIELKETGKLHLLPWTRVFGQSENSGITGNGTLCVYKCLEEEQPEYPQIFGVKMEEWQENEIIEGVSSDVTIRANWTQPDECEHTFVKSPYVVKSSCVDGYTVYLCSKCDNPVKRDITVASEPHRYVYTDSQSIKKRGDYIVDERLGENGKIYVSYAILEYIAVYRCDMCSSDEKITFTLKASDGVYTGEPVQTAVFTDGEGQVIEEAEIIYSNNIEPGIATATVIMPLSWENGDYGNTIEIHVHFRIKEAPEVERPDMDDLQLLNQHLAGWPVDSELKAIDFNNDGQTNRKDAMYLARCLAGWPNYKLTNR